MKNHGPADTGRLSGTGFNSLTRRLLRLIGRAQGTLKIFNVPRTLRESCLKNRSAKGLLIVGLSRSGTTILYRLLNAHPGVCLTYESIYMPFIGRSNADEIQAYFYEVLKQHRHLSIASHREHQAGETKSFSFENAYAYFGDKVIFNTSRVLRKNLKRTVENNIADKIIFIIRDSRARSLSVLQWPKRRNTSLNLTAQTGVDIESNNEQTVGMICGEWNRFMADVDHYCRRQSQCTWIKYEELVTQPEKVMTGINHFLELDSRQYPGHYLSTVASRSIDNWRADLDEETAGLITGMTRKYLELFKYL